MRIRALIGRCVVLAILSTHGTQFTRAETVFHYSFGTLRPLPNVPDQGPGGHEGTAGPLAALSSDVPTVGVPAGSGNASLDTSNPAAVQANPAGVVTDDVSLLDNDLIEAAGGFTYETWFKWRGNGTVNSIIALP
jgi:hypothetical protein